MFKQSLAQKQAEVKFRTLISEQHRGGKVHFKTEFTQSEMRKELGKRLANSECDFNALQKQGVAFTPYLEIGAEYGLRAALLESKYNAHGIALDIAKVPLQNMPWFANKFSLKKIPVRVCADCHTLPFPDNSFRFIFCYQTLHHFPDPLPIVREVYRCLAPGGYFFFAEEPISQKYNLNLFRRPTKITGLLKILKYLLLLPFISKIGKTETDFGIYEGTIPIEIWRKIIALFTPFKVKIDVFPFGNLTSTVFFSKWNWKQYVLDMFGGGICALMQKPPYAKKIRSTKISRIEFACPDCQGKLIANLKTLNCQRCRRVFNKTHGVWQLLPKKLEQTLYDKN